MCFLFCRNDKTTPADKVSIVGLDSFQPGVPLKGIFKHGSFGEAPLEIREKTGKKNYDVKMIMWDGNMTFHATLSENGTKFIIKPLFSDDLLDEIFLISEEEIKKLQETGDDVKAMSCPYR